ncbi:GAF domain-containing protein [Mycolicibacterium grossiae]|uniref:GAF domain-containing protein n=1 Tax=Mycolicibacterium grossiae TaxID=1552759 RepID=UPI001FEADC8D|nr:GAF domain-containing protein [Mycolicibacterium grossiae]
MAQGLHNELASLLGDLAIRMQGRTDTDSTLRAIVEGAVAAVPGTRWAGISLIQRRSVTPRVPRNPLIDELDELQTQLDDGPCLSALREQRTILIDDMTTEARWPRFTAAAVERGVMSLMSFQLFVEGESLGALNLYARDAGVFTEDSVFHR